MKRAIGLICVLALCLCAAGCGAGEETTLTGMVVSVEGTVVSLAVFDGQGERPTDEQNGELPTDQENFSSFGSEDASAPSMPEGQTPPDLPEGGQMPIQQEGEKPDGEMPQGEAPKNGERPQGGGREFDGETTQVDLANAKITVQFDGGKATGSMDDITEGVFLTITLNAKGEAVTAVVTEMSGFGQRGQEK